MTNWISSHGTYRRTLAWLFWLKWGKKKRILFNIYSNVRCICLQNIHFSCLLVVSTTKINIENNFIGEFVDDLAYITDNEGSSQWCYNEEEEEFNTKKWGYIEGASLSLYIILARTSLLTLKRTSWSKPSDLTGHRLHLFWVLYNFYVLNYLCGFSMIDNSSLKIGLIFHLLPKRKTKTKRNLEPIDIL